MAAAAVMAWNALEEQRALTDSQTEAFGSPAAAAAEAEEEEEEEETREATEEGGRAAAAGATATRAPPTAAPDFALASAPFSTNLSPRDLDIALVAGLMNLDEANGSPEGAEPGALGSSSVSRASAATTRPGGPSQKSSWRHEASVTTLWRMVKS